MILCNLTNGWFTGHRVSAGGTACCVLKITIRGFELYPLKEGEREREGERALAQSSESESEREWKDDWGARGWPTLSISYLCLSLSLYPSLSLFSCQTSAGGSRLKNTAWLLVWLKMMLQDDGTHFSVTIIRDVSFLAGAWKLDFSLPPSILVHLLIYPFSYPH